MKAGIPTTDPLNTRVTRIGSRWYCRLSLGSTVIDEMACDDRSDIGYCMGQMLRWYDKLGNSPYSKMADSSRNRQSRRTAPVGKVWYKVDLDADKKRNH